MVSAVIAAYNILPKPVVIQAGPNLTAFEGLSGVSAFRSCDSTEFSGYINSSTLLIIHGGVGATKEAILAGRRPAIFVRSANLGEHIDEHQKDWCHILFESYLAFDATDVCKLLDFVRQGEFFQRNLEAATELFDDSALREELHSKINSYLQR